MARRWSTAWLHRRPGRALTAVAAADYSPKPGSPPSTATTTIPRHHPHRPGTDRRIRSTRVSTLIVFYTTPVDATWPTDPEATATAICRSEADGPTRAEWSQYVPGKPYRSYCCSRSGDGRTPSPVQPRPRGSAPGRVHSRCLRRGDIITLLQVMVGAAGGTCRAYWRSGCTIHTFGSQYEPWSFSTSMCTVASPSGRRSHRSPERSCRSGSPTPLLCP
jgi:hypothetical protein